MSKNEVAECLKLPSQSHLVKWTLLFYTSTPSASFRTCFWDRRWAWY